MNHVFFLLFLASINNIFSMETQNIVDNKTVFGGPVKLDFFLYKNYVGLTPFIDDRTVAVGSPDGSVLIIYDIVTGKIKNAFDIKNIKNKEDKLIADFSPPFLSIDRFGQYLLALTNTDGNSPAPIFLCDLNNIDQEIYLPVSNIYTTAKFSPDGNFVCAAGFNGNGKYLITIWDITDKNSPQKIVDKIYQPKYPFTLCLQLDFYPVIFDNSWFFLTAETRFMFADDDTRMSSLNFWKFDITKKQVSQVKESDTESANVLVKYNKNGNFALVHSVRCISQNYAKDINIAKLILFNTQHPKNPTLNFQTRVIYSSGLNLVQDNNSQVDIIGECCSFSNSGNYFICPDIGSDIKVFSVNDGNPEIIATLEGHKDVVGTVSWRWDDKFIVSADKSGIMIVWNVTDIKKPVKVVTFRSPLDVISSVCWSTNGNYLSVTKYMGLTFFYDMSFLDSSKTNLLVKSAPENPGQYNSSSCEIM